jgi:hypothetical protein
MAALTLSCSSGMWNAQCTCCCMCKGLHQRHLLATCPLQTHLLANMDRVVHRAPLAYIVKASSDRSSCG